MGIYDSSLTRVQPAFKQLYRHDPSGAQWLGPLLRLGSRAGELGLPFEGDWPGRFSLPPQFEVQVASPLEYLRKLVTSSDRLRAAQKAKKQKCSEDTFQKRGLLLKEDKPTIDRACDLLDLDRMSKAWWVLEGATCVDCALITPQVTTFVEGKRTENGPATGTTWDLQRHQVFRNLDCLRAISKASSDFYVILIVEAGSQAEEAAINLDKKCHEIAEKSWPHLDKKASEALLQHYLGWTTWQEIANQLRDVGPICYPRTVEEAKKKGMCGPCEWL